MDHHGIGAAVSLGLSADADINSEDSACVSLGRDTLVTALAVADGIGAKYLGGVVFSGMA